MNIYNMWSPQLLSYLYIRAYPLFNLSKEEIFKCIDETINETAIKMMMTHNLTFGEAKMILLKILIKGD